MDIDLNLLRVFDLLMELRSVTRTADRLGVSQSAVSQSLARLRDAIGDPIFIRTRRGLQPTARALAMAADVRDALNTLASALGPTEYDPAQSHRQFTVAAGGYFCSNLVPAMIARARLIAPSVTFHIVPADDAVMAGLESGAIDLGIGAFPKIPARCEFKLLFEERMVWIAAAGSARATAPFDPKEVARLPRVRISIASAPEYAGGRTLSFVDGEPHAQERTVYDSQTAVAIVAQSDLVGLAPRRLALHHADSVTIIGPDEEGHVLSLGMLWHAQQRADPGLIWLCDFVQEICGV